MSAVQPQTLSGEASPLDVLLQRRAQPGALPPAGQIVLGTLEELPAGAQAGSASVTGLGRVSVSHSVVPLSPSDVGCGVALSVLEGGAVLVLGKLWSSSLETPVDQPITVTVDGRRQVIEAQSELELRCGEACIVLMADGRIQMRGTYITSHATATQRIVGGSVHVN